jgi:hypothetical protein
MHFELVGTGLDAEDDLIYLRWLRVFGVERTEVFLTETDLFKAVCRLERQSACRTFILLVLELLAVPSGQTVLEYLGDKDLGIVLLQALRSLTRRLAVRMTRSKYIVFLLTVFAVHDLIKENELTIFVPIDSTGDLSSLGVVALTGHELLLDDLDRFGGSLPGLRNELTHNLL